MFWTMSSSIASWRALGNEVPERELEQPLRDIAERPPIDLRIDVWGAIRGIGRGFFVDLTETAAVVYQTFSECGEGQDFEHSKSIIFGCSGECDFGLDSRQRGEMFEPVLGCARHIVL
jgi:hypothetical protein